MIITILPSSGSFHAVAYNENKVSKGQAELIEAVNINGLRPEAYSADKLRRYFEDFSTQKNSRTKNAQFHVFVSCKGTEYTHRQLLDIAHMYLKEMGYAEEGQPLLVYAHHDTPNNHIHIITSRIAPDGHRISDKFEKKRSRQVTLKIMEQYTGQRQEPTLNEIAAQALAYRYTSKAQFCSILNSLGYDTKEDGNMPALHIYKGGEEVGTIPVQLIMQHALRENKADDKRRRQLRAILKKYRDLSGNKEELAAVMKKKFDISLVYLGQKDSPFGYVVIDHKNKTVHKGGEFLSIKELLQFEDAATRFAKIQSAIDELLADNPDLTTKDINKLLYRQFGTKIHKGEITWNEQTIELRPDVQEQLRRNNRVAMGLPPTLQQHVSRTPSQQQSRSQSQGHSRTDNPLNKGGGSSDTNREWDVKGGMNVNDVDDADTIKMKW